MMLVLAKWHAWLFVVPFHGRFVAGLMRWIIMVHHVLFLFEIHDRVLTGFAGLIHVAFMWGLYYPALDGHVEQDEWSLVNWCSDLVSIKVYHEVLLMIFYAISELSTWFMSQCMVRTIGSCVAFGLGKGLSWTQLRNHLCIMVVCVALVWCKNFWTFTMLTLC